MMCVLRVCVYGCICVYVCIYVCDTHDHSSEGGRRRGRGRRGHLRVALRGRRRPLGVAVAAVAAVGSVAAVAVAAVAVAVARRGERVALGDLQLRGAPRDVPALYKQRALLQFG